MAAPSALSPVSARMGTRSSMIVGYIIMFGAIVALGVCMVLGLLVPYLVLEVVFAVATGMILSSSLHMLISASTPQENASVVTSRQLDRLRGVDRGLDHPDGSHRHIRPGNRVRFHRASCRHLDRARMHIDGQTSTITDSEQPIASGAQAP